MIEHNNMNRIKVLHLDDSSCWRGGQQQTVYLYKGMLDRKLNTLLICQPDSEYIKICDNENLPCQTLSIRGEWDLFAGYKIGRICKNGGFNIIHAHSAHALSTAIQAKIFYRSVKVIASRRVDFSIRKNPFSIHKYNNRFVNKIICISEKIRKVMLNDGIDEHKLITIHDGIDIRKFDHIKPPQFFRKNWQIPQNHILVGTVAAITGEKDYPNLLKAAKIVIDRLPNVTFMAAGNGKDENSIKIMAKQLNLENRFIFTGFQKNIGDFLKSFDIFVLASKKEGLGTSVLDALAAGLPVIGTETGGIPEMITHNENGMLVKPQNPQALADTIIELAKDKAKREMLIKKGIISVERFSINNTIEKTIALYESI